MDHPDKTASSSRLQNYGPWALIAGGSEGIGLAFARELAAAGINLLLLARREEPLQLAREQLRAEHPVQVSCAAVDLTAAGLEQQLAELTEGLDIGLLVYNAGATHGAGLFHDQALDAARRLVELNCHGPVTLCHALGGPMRARGRGGIILVSSMSGLTGGGYVATYCASKAFDIILAESLWAELKPFGVDVLGLVAGATDTPAMARSGVAIGEAAMRPEQVAREALEALPAGPLHVAGADNRAFASLLRGEDRARSIAMMSQGAAGMYGKPWPPAGT